MRFITFKFGALVAALCAVITFSLWPQAAQSEARSVSDRHLRANYGLARPQIKTENWIWKIVNGTAIDGYMCPTHRIPINQNANTTGRGTTVATDQNQCNIPFGKAIRFHALSYAIISPLDAALEECSVELEYALAASTSDLTGGSTVQAASGGDARLDFPVGIKGDRGTILFDHTENITSWWSLHIYDTPGGSNACDELITVEMTLFYEYVVAP